MSSNKITLAQINWSDEGVPFSTEFEDYYFSTDDGLAEIDYNFIGPNQLAQRFTALKTQRTFRIVETGFGSGLNFIKTAALWLQMAHANAHCHFISFEKHPMRLGDLAKTHDLLPTKEQKLREIAAELRFYYPEILPGWHDLSLFDGRIRLTLWFGDVLKGLPELSSNNKVNAWFLDGFSPAKNPQMWQPTMYQQMARLSDLNTTFATFTAAGEVRRNLAKVGFAVEKSSGFGKKREICFGHLAQQRAHSLKAPWFARPPAIEPQNKKKTAIVIGAGLAGAAVAYKLANEGWQVDVLEAEKEIATQASGNLAGTVHPLVTADWNLRSQWYLLGLKQTLKNTMPWLKTNSQHLNSQTHTSSEVGDLSGLVELLVDDKAQTRVSQAMQRVGLPDDWVKLLSAEQTSKKLGTETPYASLLFEQGGWLYPRAIIERCLDHPNISLRTQSPVTDFYQTELTEQTPETEADNLRSWMVKTDKTTLQATVLVIATGSLASQLNQRLSMPIRPVKGQVTHLHNSQQQTQLKKAVTHEGYSVSMPNGAVTGATFEAPDMSPELNVASHEENIATTQKSLPHWISQDIQAKDVAGRVAFRPTTPDHLPIIGPVACEEWMSEKYLSQSHTHAVYRYAEQRYQSGLFVSNGHGPRGLMSVFLAAQIIYADIAGDALPMPLSLYHASHPARFKIRHWRSGKS